MPHDAAAYQGPIAHLACAGLNVAGVADARAYDLTARPELQADRLLPGARRVLVLGSGGPALWEGMLADLRQDPALLAQSPHPVEDYVARRVAEADAMLPHGARRWFFTSATAEVHLDFRTLALTAGLGTPSRLGLLLHPVHGPWLGLRAACFLADEGLPVSARLGEGPCAACPAPCVSACPGEAFPEGQWEVGRCSAFHRESSECARSCAARLACPEGGGSRYPEAELRYHYDRAGGRPELRRLVGLDPAADPHQGVGPHWEAW